MSIIHVNQIRSQVTKLFNGKIDLTDVVSEKTPEKIRDDFFLSRGLAAYAIHYLCGASVGESASAVTDGSGDNGLDAIHYDESNRRLYLVQSKWIHDGRGEPENGEVKKFVRGVNDLFNMDFDRFNKKVNDKKHAIVQALKDPTTRYEIILAYTGASALAMPSKRDLQDLADAMNDISEVVFCETMNQVVLYNSLTAGIAGEPIILEIGLKAWGRKEEPHDAYYGQLSGEQIAEWWAKYRTRLFAHNLRGVLGETDVNVEMRQTLESKPSDFFYYNNGVTILSRRVSRAMAGGSGNDFATFHCEDISVVNGAQTVATIGKFGDPDDTKLAGVYVPVRIIVRGDNENFAAEVTKTNNRQNRIENRDFVALDPEQGRIKTELAIDGIDYQVLRSENTKIGDDAFDLVEATSALACASRTIRLPVQLKREIGKLWEDITRAPYKELFNADVPGLYVWRCVKIQRRIDRALAALIKTLGNSKSLPVGTHGNRVIAALAFEKFPVQKFRDPGFDIDTACDERQTNETVMKCLSSMVRQVEQNYGNSIIPTLFKNLSKCEDLAKLVREELATSKSGELMSSDTVPYDEDGMLTSHG